MSKYKILHEGKGFEASEYQEKIFEFIEKGSGNLVINAAAGSAKTTTLVNCMRFIPTDKKVIFVSFNKHIAESINSKIDNPNAIARTCSSVGYEICRENGVGTGEVNDEKYTDYIRQNIISLTQYGEVDSLGSLFGTYMRNIRELVNLCRYTLNFTVKEIERLAEKYGIDAVRDEIEVVRKVLIWGESNTDMIDQTDMVWLPNVLNLTTKRLLKDFIFIDEAQDISIAQQSLIMKCMKRGARIVAVGDRNQQINIWCGSDEAAIDKFRRMPNTIELKLPICYRCGKKIIDFANKFSSDEMYPSPTAIDGEIEEDVSISRMRIGDMVLSRNTAPLIELQQILLSRNQKAYIQGFKEIKEDFIALAKASKSKRIDINCITTDGLFPTLYKMLLSEIDRLMNCLGMDEEEALSRSNVLYLYDNIQALKILSVGLDEIDELIDKITMVFSGDAENAILLSTVHRAKGLEADRVFIYQPSVLRYNPLAQKDWEIKTEQNLRYVAYTRPKKCLFFVEEPKRVNNAYGKKEFKAEIEEMRERINYISEMGKRADAVIERSARPVIEAKAEKKNSPNKKGGLKFCNLMK